MGMKDLLPQAQMWRSSSNVDIEQVWDDISIPPHLHLRPSSPTVILQDFFSKESPPPAAVSPPPSPLALNSSLLLNPLNDAPNMRFLDSGRYSGECRNKRMMKNRVSAARSRARKQAYTNELELQVAHLRRQNALLRKQQEQLYIAAAAAGCEQHEKKKKKLHRTSSAPF